MKESYRKGLASYSGLEPYTGDGNIVGAASVRGNAGQPLSSEISPSACRSCPDLEKATPSLPLLGKAATVEAESENLCMRRHPQRENREIPSIPVFDSSNAGRSVNLSEGTAGMYVAGKSDDFVVPSTRANKAATAVAEFVEKRESPKGSTVDSPWTYRTVSWILRQ